MTTSFKKKVSIAEKKSFKVSLASSSGSSSTQNEWRSLFKSQTLQTQDNIIKNPTTQKKKKIPTILQGPKNGQFSMKSFQLSSRNPFEKTKSSNTLSQIILNINTLLPFFKDNVEFKLLFRASQHEFDTKKFHQICDQQPNTVTICLTDDDLIIGGYTPLLWKQQYETNNSYFKTDSTNQTFLFSLTNQKKFVLSKALRNKAICCFKGYGPTFGGGYDLLIGNHADQQFSSQSYFPRNFQNQDNEPTKREHFIETKKKSFRLKEWEIFKVVDKSSLQGVNFTAAKSGKLIKQQESVSFLTRIGAFFQNFVQKWANDQQNNV